MPVVRLGNHSPLDPKGQAVPGPLVTTVVFPVDEDLPTRMRTLTHADGLWVCHSAAPASWVESDDPELEAAISQHFNCPIGRPTGEAQSC